MNLSYDENRLVTSKGVRAVFVPYKPDKIHNCGNGKCLLHAYITGECPDNGGLFRCVSFTRKDERIGYWKEAP